MWLSFRYLDVFAMDEICSCGLGKKVKGLGGQNDPFMTNAKKLFAPSAREKTLFYLASSTYN